MSTPAPHRYKGFEIAAQAMRRLADPGDPSDADRRFDVTVTITRQASGAEGKSALFGVPTPEPFASPMAAQKAGVEYARAIIDGKIDDHSVDEL
jgi:hypothetical protein